MMKKMMTKIIESRRLWLTAVLMFLTATVVYSQTFQELVLNGMKPVEFAVYIFFAYLGLFLNLVVDLIKREPSSAGSPRHFSPSYWWKDNRVRLLISIILTPVVILLFGYIAGTAMNQLNAFYLGWSGDYISEILKRKGIVKGYQLPDEDLSDISEPEKDKKPAGV